MYYQYNTKNISFIKTADMLKERGMDHPEYILQVQNPDLMRVEDLYDYLNNDALKDDQEEYEQRVLMIEEECKHNVWYFLREVMRIPVSGTAMDYRNSLQYELRPELVPVIFAYEQNLSFVLDGAARSGKSLLLNLLLCHHVLCTNEITRGFFHKGFKESMSFLRNLMLTNSVMLPILTGKSVVTDSVDMSCDIKEDTPLYMAGSSLLKAAAELPNSETFTLFTAMDFNVEEYRKVYVKDLEDILAIYLTLIKNRHKTLRIHIETNLSCATCEDDEYMSMFLAAYIASLPTLEFNDDVISNPGKSEIYEKYGRNHELLRFII